MMLIYLWWPDTYMLHIRERNKHFLNVLRIIEVIKTFNFPLFGGKFAWKSNFWIKKFFFLVLPRKIVFNRIELHTMYENHLVNMWMNFQWSRVNHFAILMYALYKHVKFTSCSNDIEHIEFEKRRRKKRNGIETKGNAFNFSAISNNIFLEWKFVWFQLNYTCYFIFVAVVIVAIAAHRIKWKQIKFMNANKYFTKNVLFFLL